MDVPEDVAKKTHAKRVEDTPGEAYRRGTVLGWLVGGGFLARFLLWRFLWRAEKPRAEPSEATIVCAECGHEMSLGESEDGAPHNWSLQ
jgi:hypothetical protein